MDLNIKGKIISGQFGRILARQKSGQDLEIGELLISEKVSGNKETNSKILLQVSDLIYGSQISLQNLELVAGMGLEADSDSSMSSIEFMDKELRNYNLAVLKSLMEIKNGAAVMCKGLPGFFSELRQPNSEDFAFLTMPQNPLLFGKLRSGTNVLDFDVFLDSEDVLTHHMLVSATTGKGKSNLCSVLLWNICDTGFAGVLVLDPHDEYYGRNRLGLKDHPKCVEKNRVVYYTASDVPPGCRTLKINTEILRPWHFQGIIEWSDAQQDVINAFYREHGHAWVAAILLDKPVNVELNEASKAVVRRRLLNILDMKIIDSGRTADSKRTTDSGRTADSKRTTDSGRTTDSKRTTDSGRTTDSEMALDSCKEGKEKRLWCSGVFDTAAGSSTIHDIVSALEDGKIVIVDTSQFSGSIELLIGTIIVSESFNRYRQYKSTGALKDKPVLAILLEEAPRVLGKEVLEKGPNIFSTIAREGRKFKVGLIAITQLPSLIPRQILANINTKVIMGTEMRPERQALIESAAQDLSDDERNIASLDKGEAIITSNFAKFAMPVKIPLFDDIVSKYNEDIVTGSIAGSVKSAKPARKESMPNKSYAQDFSGIDLE